jgi:Zn-dependent protease
MGELWNRVKIHHRFSPAELKALTIGIFVIAFIFSFDDWGVEKFDFFIGLKNFLIAILLAAVTILVNQSAHRITALSTGFKAEYRIWIYGIIIGLVLTFVTKGKFLALIPGGMVVYHMAGLRLGAFRYGLNYWAQAMVALAGPLANVMLIIIFKIMLYFLPGNSLLLAAITMNIWYTIINMLPIPPLDGSHLFFVSRLVYVFSFGTIAGFLILLYFYGIFVSFLLAIVIGFIVWLAFLKMEM